MKIIKCPRCFEKEFFDTPVDYAISRRIEYPVKICIECGQEEELHDFFH